MTAAREIMTTDTTCVGERETLVDAARKLRDLGVGALPICGDDDRLKGMVTDRDIVVACIAEGGDAAKVTAGSLGGDEMVTIGADDDVEEALRTMADHQVRRLPVIDDHRLVGIISQADIARSLPPERAGRLLASISA
jgi:CBS domain-containing protein